MFKLVEDLYYSRRDLVSDGYDKALQYIGKRIPLKIHEVSSGTECWTWIIPEKWIVEEAYIEAKGKRFLDLKDNPLHIISYSLPIDKVVSKDELMRHLHTNEKRPNAIPFEFKYYERDWGFCIQHNRLKDFVYEQYHVVIKSKFEKGSLKIGELLISGETNDTIVLVAHLCHPGMVNDDLTGVAVLEEVAEILLKKGKTHHTYRVLFLPETIGSIAYLSQNETIIPTLKYGIFFEMLGNANRHALQHSRGGNSKIDKAARIVFKDVLSTFAEGGFREIISNDEMVFNGPGVDVPMISISRWPYPEYHTSDDNLSIITPERLEESKKLILKIIDVMEKDYIPLRKFKGPPFLSRYSLWVDWRNDPKLNSLQEKIFMRFEGNSSIIDIADELELSFEAVYDLVNKFVDAGLVDKVRR